MTDQVEEVLEVPSELDSLKARADILGLSYHPSIGVDKLRDKVTAALNAGDPEQEQTPEVELEEGETEHQKRVRLKNEASELVRIRVACMNPNKKEWEGEIFTSGNSAVGTFKKYVPFNADEGWHVPRMILNQLLERQCQVFYSVKDGRGGSVRKGKLIKEFSIEILDPLTTDELEELARRQAMSRSVG